LNAAIFTSAGRNFAGLLRAVFQKLRADSLVVIFCSCLISGGRLSMLVSGLHMASLLLSETEIKVNDNIKVPSRKERDEKIQQIRTGFINRLHLNRPWAYSLAFCEILNFINVIMQIYLTDWFLGGAFLSLGRLVSEPVSKDKMDPLDVVFPKV